MQSDGNKPGSSIFCVPFLALNLFLLPLSSYDDTVILSSQTILIGANCSHLGVLQLLAPHTFFLYKVHGFSMFCYNKRSKCKILVE